jgi:hypothetical protein
MKFRVNAMTEIPKPAPAPGEPIPPPNYLIGFIRVAEEGEGDVPLTTFQLQVESKLGLEMSNEYTLTIAPAE